MFSRGPSYSTLPRGHWGGVNGRRLILTNDAAYDLIVDGATGHLDSVAEITRRLRNATEPRQR
jgi:hypothetical protein